MRDITEGEQRAQAIFASLQAAQPGRWTLIPPTVRDQFWTYFQAERDDRLVMHLYFAVSQQGQVSCRPAGFRAPDGLMVDVRAIQKRTEYSTKLRIPEPDRAEIPRSMSASKGVARILDYVEGPLAPLVQPALAAAALIEREIAAGVDYASGLLDALGAPEVKAAVLARLIRQDQEISLATRFGKVPLRLCWCGQAVGITLGVQVGGISREEPWTPDLLRAYVAAVGATAAMEA